MFKRLSFMIWVLAVTATIAVSQFGCSRGAATQDNRDERDPYLKRALARKNMDDIDGAIDLLNKALDRKPDLARAHLELGLLYDAQKQDYIRAIYHYKRYLELRPDAEKKKLIEDLIRQARLSFAASLPDQPPGAIEQIAMLKREISALKGQIAVQQGGIGAAAGKPAAAASTNSPVLMPPKPAPAQAAVQTYVVQSRDTLSSIAAKMYNDPGKWKAIYDANRTTLSSPQSVRAGQTLIIPR
jgi:tetratricopeptide (TPR) repeat protein